MVKSIEQQEADRIKAINAQTAAIQEQRSSTGKLAEIMAADRLARAGTGKNAKEFAAVNDNIRVLFKQMDKGLIPQTSDAQKIRSFNVTRDKNIRQSQGLSDDANIKDAIKVDNARLAEQATKQGITLNDLKVAIQSKREESDMAAMLKVSESLLAITESAETGSVKDQKAMLRQVETQIKILKDVEGHTDPDKSPILAQALQTQKLLKENTTVFRRTGEVIGDGLMSGLGAVVGAMGNSPVLAAVTRFAQNKYTEAKDNRRERAAQIRQAAREKGDRETSALADVQGVVGDDEGDLPTKKPAGKIKAVAKTVTGGIFRGGSDTDLATEETQEGVIVAVGRVEATLRQGNIEAQKRFKQQQRDAVEARRDGLSTTSNDFLLGDKAKKEEKSGSILGDIFAGNFLADLSIQALKKVFSVAALRMVLTKAFPLAVIGTMLYSGFKSGLDSFEEHGDIVRAIGDGAAGIVETITLGFLQAETVTEWGSNIGIALSEANESLNLWIDSGIDAMMGHIRKFGESISEWFAPLLNLSIRDFLPESTIGLLERMGIIKDENELEIARLADDYDKRRRTLMDFSTLSRAERKIATANDNASLEAEAKELGFTVEQVKAVRQQIKTEDIARIKAVKRGNVEATTGALSSMGKAGDDIRNLEATRSPSSKKLETVLEEQRVIEIQRQKEKEVEKRRQSQATVIQKNNTTNNNNSAVHIAGGPSDDDHMFNRSENMQRVW